MKIYKPFDYRTQSMDPELKKDWLEFMNQNPDLYVHGVFINAEGCMCALGCLLKVVGGDPANYMKPLPDVYELASGRFDAAAMFLGPKYERVYALNDETGAYPIQYIKLHL